MNKYMHSDLYPDFHVNFIKKGSVNSVPPVSLKDLGFPDDVDYRDQPLSEITNDKQKAIVNEFVFLIERVLPRNIQDLFYRIALDPRPAYWKFFDMAADLMQLERYTDHSKRNYGQFVDHVQKGIEDMIEAGMTLAEIYDSTCVTQAMIEGVADSGFTKGFEPVNAKRWRNMAIEAQLFKIQGLEYKALDNIRDLEFDFIAYKDGEPVLAIVYVDYDYYIGKATEGVEELRDKVDRQIKACRGEHLPLLIIDPDEVDDFVENPKAHMLFRNSLANLVYAKEHNEKRAKQWMLSDVDFTQDLIDDKDDDEYIVPEGQILKIKLVSNNLCMGPMPEADEEIEQHLTLFADGRVYFSGYNFGEYGGMSPSKRTRSSQFKIDAVKAGYILSNIAMYFVTNHETLFATDVGYWDLEITNTENKTFTAGGSLFTDLVFNGVHISSTMRKYIGMPELFCFDGDARIPIEKEDDEYIFVNVFFGNNGRTYCYLCDDCNVAEGDNVLVPVGNSGDTKMAIVESINVVTADKAPFPVDKCKRVIKIVEED